MRDGRIQLIALQHLDFSEVCDGVWEAAVGGSWGLATGQGPFLAAIAAGAMTEDAAAEAGVSSRVGLRWFGHAGGVNPRAITMAAALSQAITMLPEERRRSLTWDGGKEPSAHARFSVASGVQVSLLIRRALGSAAPMRTPTACCANTFRREQTCLAGTPTRSAIANTLNTRPRKTLGWRTPAEAFNEHLQSQHQAGVATTS